MTAVATPSRTSGNELDSGRLSQRARRILVSGWLPTVLLSAVTAGILAYYGVALSTTAIFAAYIVLGITLPGTLVWRVVRRGHASFVEGVAAGTAVGYTMEVLGYIVARAVGAPLLVLAVPILVTVAFLAVPGLRRYWRGDGELQRAPTSWSWSMAGIMGLLLLWSCGKFFRFHGLSWPYNASPDNDMPFHLAILGEVKHHVPPVTPFVHGEPLLYHWFVYAEMASTSWVTGIEPQTLLYRLSLLPMLAAFVLLIAVIARRLTAVWWTGPVAAIVTYFVLAPNLYGWPLLPYFTGYYGFGVVDDASLLRPVLWTSPTQTFGALLFAPVVLLLIDLLDGERRDIRRWALFGVLLVALMGAKATYLPLLLAALLFIVGVRLVFRCQLHRAALVASGVILPFLLFAQFVLFGGAAQGLTLEPFATMKVWGISATTNFATDTNPPVWRLLLLTALFMVCWICIWGGIAGLRRRLLEPRILLLVGLGLAGIGAITLLGHAGLSQGFFFQSARPYLALAAVSGLAALVPSFLTRRSGLVLVAATAAGGVVVLLIRALGSSVAPSVAAGPRRLAFALTWPYLLLIVIVLGGALLAARRGVPRALVAALVVAALAGAGLTTAYARFSYNLRTAAADGWRSERIEPWSIPQGAEEAGRWLRDHSAPDDLVATNAHCRIPDDTVCDNSHVWIAAYSERRVLVEGWAFTDPVHVKALEAGIPEANVSYWRPDVIADNDRAFSAPSAEAINRLRGKYHVGWLFVDERQSRPPAALENFATLRFRLAHCVIYEIKR